MAAGAGAWLGRQRAWCGGSGQGATARRQRPPGGQRGEARQGCGVSAGGRPGPGGCRCVDRSRRCVSAAACGDRGGEAPAGSGAGPGDETPRPPDGGGGLGGWGRRTREAWPGLANPSAIGATRASGARGAAGRRGRLRCARSRPAAAAARPRRRSCAELVIVLLWKQAPGKQTRPRVEQPRAREVPQAGNVARGTAAPALAV